MEKSIVGIISIHLGFHFISFRQPDYCFLIAIINIKIHSLQFHVISFIFLSLH